jgi:hypothetical protein
MTTTILVICAILLIWQAYSYGKYVGYTSVPKETKVFLFQVEQVGDQTMAYTMEDYTFVARGKTIEDATAAVRARVPGYEFYIAVSKQDESV